MDVFTVFLNRWILSNSQLKLSSWMISLIMIHPYSQRNNQYLILLNVLWISSSNFSISDSPCHQGFCQTLMFMRDFRKPLPSQIYQQIPTHHFEKEPPEPIRQSCVFIRHWFCARFNSWRKCSNQFLKR